MDIHMKKEISTQCPGYAHCASAKQHQDVDARLGREADIILRPTDRHSISLLLLLPILNDSRKDTKEPVTVVASGEEDQSSGERERLFPFYTILYS